MDSWRIINVVLNGITLFNSIMTGLICIFIIIIIIIYHRENQSIPILLAGHTCFSMLLSSIVLTSMTISSLCGFIGIELENSSNRIWCIYRGFFIHGFLCIVYDSYALQSIFRFCRVVFYRRKLFHSFKLYCFIIPIDIIFALISISPVLYFHDVIYLSSEYYCQTPFTNLGAMLYIAARLYGFPLFILFFIYSYLIKYLKNLNLSLITFDARRRALNNTRDFIMIKRLLIQLILLILLGLPSVILLFIFIITSHLPSITYRIGWLCVSFSSFFLIFMLIKYTSPLRDTIKQLIKKMSCQKHRIVPQQTTQIPMRTN
ncbi:unnamed protein product [Adineta steineri]|uniref:G-protein coupled receptors family 1 profile domain-containing protein n=1 Tax=Adineta steineri TaxID=433720 RepID=A0A813ZIU2_9BILA|nr:unnamed protein product [Adineta steineri]